MIWRYKLATGGYGYGSPVEVYLSGYQRAIYQFPGGGQQCAVIDIPTGDVLALVSEKCTGYPQERARQAVRDGVRDVSGLPVINNLPSVVGVMRRYPCANS